MSGPQPHLIAGVYLLPDGSLLIQNGNAAKAAQVPAVMCVVLMAPDGKIILTSELPPKETAHALSAALGHAVAATQNPPQRQIIAPAASDAPVRPTLSAVPAEATAAPAAEG